MAYNPAHFRADREREPIERTQAASGKRVRHTIAGQQRRAALNHLREREVRDDLRAYTHGFCSIDEGSL